MLARLMLCAGLLFATDAPAHALCRDDIKELKPLIERLKQVSPQRYRLALIWWGDAVEAERGSETECLHFLAMARKALHDPLPQIAACDAPNMSLPRCQNGGAPEIGMGVPVQPVDAIGGGLGLGAGGGGGGGAGGASFTPPGSPTIGTRGEATGNER